jgi:ribosomal protein S27E
LNQRTPLTRLGAMVERGYCEQCGNYTILTKFHDECGGRMGRFNGRWHCRGCTFECGPTSDRHCRRCGKALYMILDFSVDPREVNSTVTFRFTCKACGHKQSLSLPDTSAPSAPDERQPHCGGCGANRWEITRDEYGKCPSCGHCQYFFKLSHRVLYCERCSKQLDHHRERKLTGWW